MPALAAKGKTPDNAPMPMVAVALAHITPARACAGARLRRRKTRFWEKNSLPRTAGHVRALAVRSGSSKIAPECAARASGQTIYGYVLGDPINSFDPLGLLPGGAQAIVNEAMSQNCGDSRAAHYSLLEKRVARNWEAISEYGKNLRLAENYLTNYSNLMDPPSGKYTPRPLVYATQAVVMTPAWQAKRIIENAFGRELQSPATLDAMAAGYEGANDAFQDYLLGRSQYDCVCRK